MAIQYDFLALPGGNATEDGNKLLYPKVVKSSMVTFRQLAEDVSHSSTYTVADLLGMMDAIATHAALYLNNSCHVELAGLGTLSLNIACDKDAEGHQPIITSASQIKPSQLHVTKVFLDAKPEFMHRLQGPFVRAKDGFPSNNQRAGLDAEQRRAALLTYLADNPSISIRRYASLTGLSAQKASRELHAFADPLSPEQLLTVTGVGTHILFVKKG